MKKPLPDETGWPVLSYTLIYTTAFSTVATSSCVFTKSSAYTLFVFSKNNSKNIQKNFFHLKT